MSDDKDYGSFLEKANEACGSTSLAPQSHDNPARVKTPGEEAPPSLKNIGIDFVSESDESFDPVVFQWKKAGLPEHDALRELFEFDGSIESMSVEDFDARQSYTKALEAVKSAGNGNLAIYKLQLSSTRYQYYILSPHEEKKLLVGLKTLGVES